MATHRCPSLCVAAAAMSFALTIGMCFAEAQDRPRSAVDRRQQPQEGFWANQRAARNLRHSRDYSIDMQRYTSRAARIDPAIARAESEMLGRQMQAVQRDLAIVKKEVAGQPEVVGNITNMESKLAAVSGTQKMLHAACSQASIDGQSCAEMCSKIAAALEEIVNDHAKLMKQLGHEETTEDSPQK